MSLHIMPNRNIPEPPKNLIPLSNEAASDFVRQAGEEAMQGVRDTFRYGGRILSSAPENTFVNGVKPIIKNPEIFAPKMTFLGKLVTKYLPQAFAIFAGIAAGIAVNKIIDKIAYKNNKKEG